MPGVKGDIQVPKGGKKVKYPYGEVSKGKQRGIKVGSQTYTLRGKGETEGKEVNVHKTGAYVGKEAQFYKELATVIASVHAESGSWPGKGIVKVGKTTEVIITPA